MTSYKDIYNCIITGEEDKLKQVIDSLLKQGKSPFEIISEGLLGSMSTVGEQWKAGELFIPEVLMAAHAITTGMEILKPMVMVGNLAKIYKGKVLIGTIQGDLHNIGKKLVCLILESGGFTVTDLGVDVPANKFVEAVRQEKPAIVGMSALLTTTMPRMKEVIEALKQAHLKDNVKVMIGGAPVTQAFADSIGADAYAPDAVSALDRAKELLGTK